MKQAQPQSHLTASSSSSASSSVSASNDPFKKISSRKDFYKWMFAHDRHLDLSPALKEALEARHISLTDDEEFSLGRIIHGVASDVQIMMLNQSSMTKQAILAYSIGKTITDLKAIYKTLFPQDCSGDNPADEVFWRFITQALSEAIQYNYNEEVIINYLTHLILYQRLADELFGDKNSLSAQETMTGNLWLVRDINHDDAIARHQLAFEQVRHRVENLYDAIKPYNFTRSLTIAGITTGALVVSSWLSVPIMATLGIGGTGFLLSAMSVARQLTENAKQYFLKVATKYGREKIGSAYNPAQPDRLKHGILASGQKTLMGHVFIKKTVPATTLLSSKDKETFELHYDFPQIVADITLTQQKKIKRHRPHVSQATLNPHHTFEEKNHWIAVYPP